MKFPTYVPKAVRVQITAMIDGDAWDGWAASLAWAEQRLAEIEGEIATKIRHDNDEHLDSLRRQRASATKHRDLFAGYLECLQRLAQDSRMREVFDLLTREFTDDQQWRNFISAAWAARIDYSEYRERLKRATTLNGEISKAADKLAKLIRQFADNGINGPGEFFSIPELLRQTDNHEMQDHNLRMWRSMRALILGDPPRRDIPEIEQAQEEGDQSTSEKWGIRIIGPNEKPEIDPVEERRNTLRYAWRTAPDLPALLDTVSKAARDFEPGEDGMIGAAIKSRQQSTKTEYLRAFGNLLTDVLNIALTTPLMQAIAIVANVVINLPDVDVSYDDVRHALVKPSGMPLENSGEK